MTSRLIFQKLSIIGLVGALALSLGGCTSITETNTEVTPTPSREAVLFAYGIQVCISNETILSPEFSWDSYAVDEDRNWIDTTTKILNQGQTECAYSDNNGFVQTVQFRLYQDNYLVRMTATGYEISKNNGEAVFFYPEKTVYTDGFGVPFDLSGTQTTRSNGSYRYYPVSIRIVDEKY